MRMVVVKSSTIGQHEVAFHLIEGKGSMGGPVPQIVVIQHPAEAYSLEILVDRNGDLLADNPKIAERV